MVDVMLATMYSFTQHSVKKYFIASCGLGISLVAPIPQVGYCVVPGERRPRCTAAVPGIRWAAGSRPGRDTGWAPLRSGAHRTSVGPSCRAAPGGAPPGTIYPDAMATLRDAQKQLTRKLLLEKGLELFQSKGYASTTIDDIAAGAGTTRTTFYLHFTSKVQLMVELINEVDAILTEADDPPLSTVIELGRRDLVQAWLDRKFDQWVTIRPYLLAAHQAAPSEPEIDATIEKWFEDTAASMNEGLDRAGRFDPSTRRIRCLLAFGQFEYLSRRWFRLGWMVDRETCLETLTDSWCYLLTEE